MIKVFMNSGDDFLIDLGSEQKELALLYKFQDGVHPEASLKLDVAGGEPVRVKVSQINNMQLVQREQQNVNKVKRGTEAYDKLVNSLQKDFKNGIHRRGNVDRRNRS